MKIFTFAIATLLTNSIFAQTETPEVPEVPSGEDIAGDVAGDLGGDLVPEEAGVIGGLAGDLIADEEEFQGPPYYCIFGPGGDGSYSEDIVEAGVADTCGDFCKCWLVKDDCMSVEDVNAEGLEACFPDDRPKAKDTVLYNGVTRVVFAFAPMTVWLAWQFWKDVAVMEVTNHYYRKAWRLFAWGYLGAFVMPAILFLVMQFTDNIKVKFWFLFFCNLEFFYAFAI